MTDYYVAKGGNDADPGTEAEPWLTIQKAADTVTAGNNVYVKVGTYYERITLQNSGSVGAYITFQNYGNDVVDINGNGGVGDMVTSDGLSYIKMLGLKVGNSQGKGFYIKTASGNPKSHFEIKNNIIHDLYAGGSAASAVYFTYISDFIVDNNEIYNVDPYGNEVIRVAEGCSDFIITNNDLHDNHFIGIDVVSWSADVPTRGLIKGNIVHDCISTEPTCTQCAHGIYVDGATYIVIEDNISYHNNIGIAIGAENSVDTSKHIIVRRNIVYNNTAVDLYLSNIIDGNTEDNVFIHNTVYYDPDTEYPATIKIKTMLGSNIFKNNVIYVYHDYEFAMYNFNTNDIIDSDYNCFYPNDRTFYWLETSYASFSLYQAGSGEDAHSICQDPKFVDAANHDFHLQGGSPCINAGDFLTTTTSSGSGTAITVVDAKYFTDGYNGLFEGDLIKVGSNSSVRITNVNYTTNVITVNRSISWGNGDGVSYPYYGSAPDIGVYESSEKTTVYLELVKMEDEELIDIRDLKVTEGIDKIAKATFRIPTRTLTGFESIKIEVDRGNGYKCRFHGNIKSYTETEYNEIEIEAESKEALFKGENVPYTEVAYTSKTGDWIVKQLVLDFHDWCDTSALAVLDTIGYVHFVEGNILDALTEIAEMCNKYWFWEPEDGKIRFITSGDLASGTTINTEYISEEDWSKDETEIKNMIHIKGGHVDGNPSNALVIKIAWNGESDQQYGRREYTHACEEIINESTAQKLADGLLALHKDPIETGEAFDVPYDELLKVGRTVAISQTLHDGTYLIKTIEIDFEYETMNIQFSEMPWMLSHEIRDMQKELAILKRNAINTYESGKPILIKKELLKRDSTVSLTETYNDEMELPITLPGTFIGGLSLISDSIHKRD